MIQAGIIHGCFMRLKMKTIFIQKKHTLIVLLAGILIMPMSIVHAAGQNGNLDIQVLETSGANLSGAAVCLGTAANSSQFGSLVTDERGIVRFRSVPNSPLRVTVSRPGYQAETREMDPLFEDRMLVMKLATGWQKGPTCTVSATTAAESNNNLMITRLDLVASAGKQGVVQVTTRVRGGAGQMRISESANFSGASWQPYKPSVSYSMGNGQQLYVQVRRYVKANGATLQALSPVAIARVE
jgi:hypothetical protein